MDYASRILVVEDEPGISGFIAAILTANGYDAEKAANGKEALMMISSRCPDAVVLDLGLPDIDGQKIIASVREWSSVPILVVSARTHEKDKITAFDLGADDYLTKPFQLSELNSRIKAVLRRRQFNGSNIIKFNEISFNTESKSVTIRDKEITLTKKEYDLLLFFIVNKNRVLTKEAIAEHLWADNIDLSDSFDFIYTHLNNIRKKIKMAGGTDYIKTIYGMGYKLTDK